MPSANTRAAEAKRLYEAGCFDEAADHAARLLAARRNDPGLLHLLGASLARMGRAGEARRHLRRAVQARPGAPEIHFDLAYTYQAEGRFDEALRALDKGVRQCRANAMLVRAKAEILRMARRHDEALRELTPLVETGADPDVLVAYAAACAGAGAHGLAIDRLTERVDALPEQHRMHVLFALGECHERLDNFQAAFACYVRANALKVARFDPAAHARAVDHVISAWTPDVLESLPDPGLDASRAILIVGMPRSGTTLVEQVLGAHPDVAPGGELNVFHKLLAPCMMDQSAGSQYLCEPDRLTREHTSRIARAFLEELRRVDRTSPHVTDKTPLNVMHLGPAFAALRGVRVIHCVRDAMDTCVSCFARDFTGAMPWAYDFENLGTFYRDCARLAAHWESLGAPIHRVVYEDLVREQETTTRAMMEFLNLAWHDACLRPHESLRVARTASMEQVRRPVYQTAVGRAARFGDALDPLRHAVGDAATATIRR